MKRRILTGLIALSLVAGMPFAGGVMAVHAEEADTDVTTEEADTDGEVVTEVTNDKIVLKADLADADGFLSLCVGDEADVWADVYDSNGEKLEYEKDWILLSDEELDEVGFQVQFYSEYDDAKKASEDENRGDFEAGGGHSC